MCLPKCKKELFDIQNLIIIPNEFWSQLSAVKHDIISPLVYHFSSTANVLLSLFVVGHMKRGDKAQLSIKAPTNLIKSNGLPSIWASVCCIYALVCMYIFIWPATGSFHLVRVHTSPNRFTDKFLTFPDASKYYTYEAEMRACLIKSRSHNPIENYNMNQP